MRTREETQIWRKKENAFGLRENREKRLSTQGGKEPRRKLEKFTEKVERRKKKKLGEKVEREKVEKLAEKVESDWEKERRIWLDQLRTDLRKQRRRRGRSRTVRLGHNSASKVLPSSQTALQFSQTSIRSQSSSLLDSLSSQVSCQAITVASSSPRLNNHNQWSSQVNSHPAQDLFLDSQMSSQVTCPSALVSTCLHESSVSETIITSGKGFTGTIIPEINTELQQTAPTVSENSEVDILYHQGINSSAPTDVARVMINDDTRRYAGILGCNPEEFKSWIDISLEPGLDILMNVVHHQLVKKILDEPNKFDDFRFNGDISEMYVQNELGIGIIENWREKVDYGTNDNAEMFVRIDNGLIPGLVPDALFMGESFREIPVYCIPVQDRSVGFDYRFHMTSTGPTLKILRKRDKDWEDDSVMNTINFRRWMENSVADADSQDQMIAGKDVVIFQGTLARQLGKNDPQICAFEGSVFTHSNIKSGMAVKGCSLMAKDEATGYDFIILDTEGKWNVRAMMTSQECGAENLYEVPRSVGIQFQEEWQPVFYAIIGELPDENGSLGVVALGAGKVVVKHHENMPLPQLLTMVKVMEMVQFMKFRVLKFGRYWEGRGAKMRKKRFIRTVSYDPP